MKQIFILTAILSIISLTGISHAEMYQWTDENGAVHFSDSPVDLKEKGEVEVKSVIESPQAWDKEENDVREEQRQIREEENEKWRDVRRLKEAEIKVKDDHLRRQDQIRAAQVEAEAEAARKEAERLEKRDEEREKQIDDLKWDMRKFGGRH